MGSLKKWWRKKWCRHKILLVCTNAAEWTPDRPQFVERCRQCNRVWFVWRWDLKGFDVRERWNLDLTDKVGVDILLRDG